MRAIIALLFLSLCSFQLLAQEHSVSGTVIDANTGETVPGATVFINNKVLLTDIDGKFALSLPNGIYPLNVKFVGYETYEKTVEVKGAPVVLEIMLGGGLQTEEVEVVGDIAVDRKTPVAFSDIPAIRIKEELGNRDLPMLMNSTPGVYATQSGGGDGDARINIRGFNQRNIAVMIDGIPMNDMENGWVYWSNWFGLDQVIQKTQIQRGLGATKLSVPTVGGTMNIITAGIENKQKISISSEFGNTLNLRESISYNSGRLKGNWGITAAISAGTNRGWVENLRSRRLFYYLKVQKQFGNHTFTASVMGSPQEHFQRQQRERVSFYDPAYASRLGIDTTGAGPGVGIRHNQFWGVVRRTRTNPNADEEMLTSLLNYYHKPIYNLKHFYSKKSFSLSNIAYASTGNGGGTQLSNTILNSQNQIDFQSIYNTNTTGSIFVPPYDLAYVNDTSQYKARNYIYSNRNDHFWGGLLTTAKYKLNSAWEFNAGIDARYFVTHRYRQVYDLLGGDYVTEGTPGMGLDQNNPSQVVFREGDIFNYRIRSFVRQAGLFLLAEYTADTWSAFFNVTGSFHQYNRINYFLKKDDAGNYQSSGWQNFISATAKGGMNYNFNKKLNAFINSGFLSRAPMLSNVYNGRTLNLYRGIKNENIIGNEAGLVYKTKETRVALNGYYTIWQNRPVTQTINVGTEAFNVAIPGMNALHYGVELEGEYKPDRRITINGIASIGNWTWTSDAEAFVTNIDGTEIVDTVKFQARGVRVGDAAQVQFGGGIRYTPFKRAYISPRITYFTRNFADFDPESLQGTNGNRQSWEMPSYFTIDVSAGYTYPLANDKYELGVRIMLMNLTNEIFISDARNNDFGTGFDAASAGVYMGQGFRWSTAVNFTF